MYVGHEKAQSTSKDMRLQFSIHFCGVHCITGHRYITISQKAKLRFSIDNLGISKVAKSSLTHECNKK